MTDNHRESYSKDRLELLDENSDTKRDESYSPKRHSKEERPNYSGEEGDRKYSSFFFFRQLDSEECFECERGDDDESDNMLEKYDG